MWYLKTKFLPWLYWRHMLRGGTFDIKQVLDQPPGIFSHVRPIIAAHAVAPERLVKSLDISPVEFQTWAHDEPGITNDAAIAEPHQIFRRHEGRRCGLDPRNAFRDQPFLPPLGLRAGEDAGADQRPTGLIGMGFRWFDNGDVETGIAPFELCGDRDAGRAPADDHDGMI